MSVDVIFNNNKHAGSRPADTIGDEQAKEVCASAQEHTAWTPSYPGETYEVPYFSDSSGEEDNCMQTHCNTASLVHSPSTATDRSRVQKRRTHTHRLGFSTVSAPSPMPSPSEFSLAQPNSFSMSIGTAIVRVIKHSDGYLLLSALDCFLAAGFCDPNSTIRRLSKRFGPFTAQKIVFNSRSRNPIHVYTLHDCVRMLQLYMGVCRCNKEACQVVITELQAYIR